MADFAKAQSWAKDIVRFAKRHRLKVDYRIVDNRRVGRQKLPDRLLADSPETLLSLAGTRREFEAFGALCDHVLKRAPALRDLFAQQPHRVMAFEDQWDSILVFLEFVRERDVGGLYLREVDLPGIDTKFIGEHKGILDRVLRAALPSDLVHDRGTGVAGHAFERRYGFRCEQPLVRFRMLGCKAVEHYDDMSVPLDQFATTPIPVATVFIVENKMNLLAFPQVENSLAIWGQGYAVTRLSAVPWLADRRLVYFGDIDTHGFSILDRLRKAFPETRSMLMDRATLIGHRQAWVQEPDTKRQLNDLTRLNDDECALFDELRNDRLGTAVRLEQEFVGYRWIEAAAKRLAS